jgi:starch synthase
MDVLMVAAELSPYVRESEAADSIASLSKALKQQGHDVTVAMPRHPGFEAHGLLVARRLTPLVLPAGGLVLTGAAGSSEVTVLDGQLASGVRLVLFDGPGLFDREGVYGENGREYPDNAARFAWLAQAAVALVRQRAQQGQPFDVVHLHDWAAALVPIALSRTPGSLVPVVLTVHDFARQGILPLEQAEALGLPKDLASDHGLKLDAHLNVLKGGVLFSDAVTTASLTYVEEGVNEPVTGPLLSFLEGRGVSLVGIAGAIDYGTNNPATDPLVPYRFDAEDASNKGRCKTELVRTLGLELDPGRPLAVAFGELTEAEGADVLVAALPNILESDVAVVLAGPLSASLTAAVQALTAGFPETFKHVAALDDTLEHRLLAGADLLLMPARRAPVGTQVLRGYRYGAVPVAHATGALRELVVDADRSLETGTGFVFDEMTPTALLAAVQRACIAYASREFPELRRRVMRQDVGWDRPGRRFLQVYRQAIAAKSE